MNINRDNNLDTKVKEIQKLFTDDKKEVIKDGEEPEEYKTKGICKNL